MSPYSLRSRLIGAWELQSYCAYKVSNPEDKIYPLGPNAQGIIMYTPDGHMSAHLRRPGQPRFASGDGISSATEAEWADVGRNYVAYAGRFFLDERKAEPLLLHEMRVSNIPRLVGDVQRRTVEMTMEDGVHYLHLGIKGESMVNGEMRIVKLKWKRMPDNHMTPPPPKL
ncbi:hypothetical protein M011DRAFT_476061 [Sporormia fimetaria CBS 119925]|uniref:Lipocalin-like domain-containing protein n=1 Tax=Sporormia fimetaria CBS 119925 TaxID=1340428 RepID=A0A6A6VDL1_9PLEO|nr:hypothetical protein M011DRAFT_476061 [Sporormia fimetaria CBS 119925]